MKSFDIIGQTKFRVFLWDRVREARRRDRGREARRRKV